MTDDLEREQNALAIARSIIMNPDNDTRESTRLLASALLSLAAECKELRASYKEIAAALENADRLAEELWAENAHNDFLTLWRKEKAEREALESRYSALEASYKEVVEAAENIPFLWSVFKNVRHKTPEELREMYGDHWPMQAAATEANLFDAIEELRRIPSLPSPTEQGATDG